MTDCLLHHTTRRPANQGLLCYAHSNRIKNQLADMPELWCWANGELAPGRTGGGRGSAMSLGVNIAALDFAALNDVLPELYAWERVVREERDLTPREKDQTKPATLVSIIGFLLIHHDWITQQPWVDDYLKAVHIAHTTAMAASRMTRASTTRLPCPTTIADTTCPGVLHMPQDPTESVICRDCGREWSSYWLLRVLMSDDVTPIYLEASVIAVYYNVNTPAISKLADKVRRWGKLYELHDVAKIMDARREKKTQKKTA